MDVKTMQALKAVSEAGARLRGGPSFWEGLSSIVVVTLATLITSLLNALILWPCWNYSVAGIWPWVFPEISYVQAFLLLFGATTVSRMLRD